MNNQVPRVVNAFLGFYEVKKQDHYKKGRIISAPGPNKHLICQL